MSRDILYVDDEMDNLVVFQATFEDAFNVWTASSGQEALELMENLAFPVVVADQRMPSMTGSELFDTMRRKYPHTKRIMLTGYADSKAMLDAINLGQVYYFIKKPWEQEFVFMVLMHAIESYDLSISNLALTDRLVTVDRCATLGRSAARMAHEMGNQLSMLPLLELIEDEYSDHKDLVQAAAFARQTHERLVQLINEVKTFVPLEHEEVAMQPHSLSEVVHELVEFLRYDSSLPLEQLTVRIDGEPVVKGHKVKLQQVLINLLKNAAHAVRSRTPGEITLTVGIEGANATLIVADNGCGMTPEVAARIWEPFFTTKGDEGTGLGLDIVKAMVVAHGGTIHCETAPGQGATFTIRLPMWQSAATANAAGTVNPAAAAVEMPGMLAQTPPIQTN